MGLVSIVDFDRDGGRTIYVTNSKEGSKNALYHNIRRTFTDVGKTRRRRCESPRLRCFHGRGLGDYDNDGYEDLLLINGASRTVHNDAGHGFTRDHRPKSACRLDQCQHRSLVRCTAMSSRLLIGGYYSEDVDLGTSRPLE